MRAAAPNRPGGGRDSDTARAAQGPPARARHARAARRAAGTGRRDRICSIGSKRSRASCPVVVENVLLLEDVLRSRRELESTFNSLADLVVVSDSQLRVTHANQAFAPRLGRRAADLIARPLREFFGPIWSSWVERLGPVPDAGGGSESESRELQDPVLGGTFLFTVSPLVGREDERIGTVVVARDVTEQAQTRGRTRRSCAIA